MKIPENLGELPKDDLRDLKVRILREINFIEAERVKCKQELTKNYKDLCVINKLLGRTVFKGSPVPVIDIPQPKKEEIEITITDHAALRYLERVKGLDVEKLKAEIGDSIPNEVIKGQFEVVQLDDIGYRLAYDRGKATVLTTIKNGRTKAYER